jgi:transglutaminase-like putative cysteine protease
VNTILTRPNSDVIDEFLFETKQGHCEYFATSMVLMLRTLNIPARLATGYSVDQQNAVTGYFEVRQRHAHAWVEAYIAGHGWMTFEPTSSFQLPQTNKPFCLY